MKTHRNIRINRRSFLRKSACLSAAAIAAPLVLPSGVLAANGQPGANDRIGVGFIGIGRQASGLLQMLLGRKEAKFLAVADVNLNRAQAAAKAHGATAYQNYRELLKRKDVDAIVTATPEHWRGLIVLESCQAGKDLYVEKPMTLTIREGRLMVRAVRKYKRVFQTGSQQRCMLPNYIGCEMVRTGKLGPIQRIIARNYPSPWKHKLPPQPVPEGLDWERWCGPAPVVPYNEDLYLPRANPGWLSFRPYSGGEMTGWGAHGFDQVQWALGMDDSGPIEVWTEGPPFDPPIYTASEPKTRGDNICQHPTVFFRYPGDIVMELGAGPEGGAIFIGEKGRLTIDRAICKSDPPELAEEAMEHRPAKFTENHLKNWLDCIKSREKPVADVEIGHRSATVCHLGNIARWTGRRLRWDPVQERFPDDAAANDYLDRERRKPYTLPEI
ncbi:MAG: Gfo/Idh/MocA family oxidoreductase [Candidatus Omnitrophica bacterium]|nr:Gfo/Idh/MocA family oxidoreductase [Candidatus Omnitrophota bacterium]